ncbi:MAG: transcription antitermination factor NusB [Gammaproteobacteria bacterium]|jgi:N utilization substance protein B|nr:transcription antitermination factor NusB [Gammaproteobacteria bacterium]MDC1081749.1 transcription antitermination factor NusB [Gammaproteobacteria bacterium]|tara:strand:+ start:180 stop:593 length:414 start_codon:yes stop_codon:yes gene_type:complete
MKNLVNFKVAVKTRECLVQAIYQMLFNDDSVAKVIDQFKDEHKTKKVDFKMFSMSLRSINKNKKKIESILTSLEIKNSSMELIDKSILFFAINEMLFGNLDKPVAIDESLRLSKKFSSPESYKFINVSLDKFFKTLS